MKSAIYVIVQACLAAHAATVWPAPQHISSAGSSIELKANFAFKCKGPTLAAACDRYLTLLKSSGSFASQGLDAVDVVVASSDETLFFGVDESYTLTIANSTASISAPTLYGALHALETFSQLADNYGRVATPHLAVPATLHISDAPRFAWRGLMIDVARRYYEVKFIEHIIDTMVASKLNVLHVHFTDDQSFPVASTQWPKLSGAGAFRDAHGTPLTYTHDDLRRLVAFATARGVILVPEFDMPAHTSAWRAGYPEYVTSGMYEPFSHGDALRPDLDATYTFVDSLLGELASFFGTSEFRESANLRPSCPGVRGLDCPSLLARLTPTMHAPPPQYTWVATSCRRPRGWATRASLPG